MSEPSAPGDLARLIRQQIASGGPVTLGRFMALALSHPDHGYYMKRDPFGREGDFITAPEISQMFGELIGLWTLDLCQRVDLPAGAPVHLLELGPGRGTLMADALRAIRSAPAGAPAVQLRPMMVEISPLLRQQQASKVPGVQHYSRVDAALEGLTDASSVIILANEFFDALPVEQLRTCAQGWQQRAVSTDEQGSLVWSWTDCRDPDLLAAVRGATHAQTPPHEDAPVEICLPARQIMADCVARLGPRLLGFLVIDYGYVRSAPGDTLQALRGNAFAEPLDTPGDADLTAHVDFQALAEAALGAGGHVSGPTTQGQFLRALGLDVRTAMLTRQNPEQAEAIAVAARRLADPGQMGALFKVMGVSGRQDLSLAGLPPPGKGLTGTMEKAANA